MSQTRNPLLSSPIRERGDRRDSKRMAADQGFGSIRGHPIHLNFWTDIETGQSHVSERVWRAVLLQPKDARKQETTGNNEALLGKLGRGYSFNRYRDAMDGRRPEDKFN
ncbi:hypothetical protein PM082_020612 [Marasmius tenuissimus]|nr:hypothetical protein PM082_020612 [Marasmius tenuissimus]